MVPMAHLEPTHLVHLGGKEEKMTGEKGRKGEKRKERKEKDVSLNPAAGAARFWVLILQINLDPHVFSHMAQS